MYRCHFFVTYWLKPRSHGRLIRTLNDCGVTSTSRSKTVITVVMMFRSGLRPYKDDDAGSEDITWSGTSYKFMVMFLTVWFGFHLVSFDTQGNLLGNGIRLSEDETNDRVLQTSLVLACSACKAEQHPG